MLSLLLRLTAAEASCVLLALLLDEFEWAETRLASA